MSTRSAPGSPALADDPVGPESTVRERLPLLAVPRLAVTAEALRLRVRDARSAYLLSLVDGQCTVEVILDVSLEELDPGEARSLLAEMLRSGIIELDRHRE